MASEPVRDPAKDHLLTPKNSALIIIDNSRCRWLAQLIPCLCLFHLKAEPWNRWAQPSPLGRLHGVTGTFVMGLSELWRRGWDSTIECGALYRLAWAYSDTGNKALVGILASARFYRRVLKAN